METCPCQSALQYEKCCGPIHKDFKKAKTPQSLMRARYSAYVKNKIDFIMKTHHPEKVDGFDQGEAESWANESEWLGLRILNSSEEENEGEVLFECTYELDDKTHLHRERSTFKRWKGNWYFFDGKLESPSQERVGPKIGRNDPCPCGSGKKFKKCCH